MFFRSYSLLMGLARPEGVAFPHLPAPMREEAENRARLALARELSDLPLSQRLANPQAWNRVQTGRRQALEALLPMAEDPMSLNRVLDLVGALCEESNWSRNAAGEWFDDEGRPELDFQCAETAALLAWTSRACAGKVPPRVSAKLQYEVRRRVFSPFMAHDDYPFQQAEGVLPACILADLTLCAIVLETDDARRAALLKKCLRLLDRVTDAIQRRTEPLSDAACQASAIADLCLLLRRLTRGKLDLTNVFPTEDQLDRLLFSWIEGELFLDPASGNLCAPLSGAELFRLGLYAGDSALTALGAQLHRAAHRPSGTLTGRLMDLSCANLLEAEGGRPPRIKRGATSDGRLMTARLGKLALTMHAGGHRGNAGGLVLFHGGQPILVEVPGCANVPVVNGRRQLDAPDLEPEGDFEAREDGEVLSMDLTHAYPAAAGLSAYQRTAMVLRREDALRLVEAFECSTAGTLCFRFFTPQKPELLLNGVRLGPVDIRWEESLKPSVEPLHERFPDNEPSSRALYRVELRASESAARRIVVFQIAQS